MALRLFRRREAAGPDAEGAPFEVQGLIHASAVPIVAFDTEGIVTFWNGAAERVFGWTAAEAVGRLLPIVPEDMHEEFRWVRERVIAGQPFTNFEARRRRKDGSPVDVSFSNAAIRNADGEVKGIVAVIVDITERKRAEQAAKDSEEQLRLALASAEMGAWAWDVESGDVRWFGDLDRLFGVPPGGFEGTFEGWLRRIHPDDVDYVQRSLERALVGEADYDIELRIVRGDGAVRWMTGLGEVFRDESGKPLRMLGVTEDVTDRKRREEALAFLAEASEALSRTLDYERTLSEIARLSVPRLADCCVVDVVDEERAVRHVAVVHVDPEKERLVRDLERRYPTDPDDPSSPMGRAIRTGRPEIIDDFTEPVLRRIARDEEHLDGLLRLNLSSSMILPLTARGRTLGVINFLSAESGRRYSTQELTFAEDLARHAALAIDNARLYEQRSYVARTLQRSLLPPALPVIPGIEVAARYRAAGEAMEVGGDFYDLFEAAGEGWGLVVGDVCGKGPDAAAITGLARHTIRAAAMRAARPSRVLKTLNDAVYREYAASTFCTVVYAHLTRGDGAVQAVVASGGHPLPFHLTAAGDARTVGSHGTILGAFEDPELEDVPFALAPGDALVLYTDGLIDWYGGDITTAQERLAALLRESAGDGAEEIMRKIEASLQDERDGAGRDDIALLVVRITQ